MTSTIESNISHKLQGDLNSGRGQFGQTVELTTGTDITHTPGVTFADYYHNYCINATANINFNLATIGVLASEVQQGHSIKIYNKGTNTISVRDGGALVISITPGLIGDIIAEAGNWSGVILGGSGGGGIQSRIENGPTFVQTNNTGPTSINIGSQIINYETPMGDIYKKEEYICFNDSATRPVSTTVAITNDLYVANQTTSYEIDITARIADSTDLPDFNNNMASWKLLFTLVTDNAGLLVNPPPPGCIIMEKRALPGLVPTTLDICLSVADPTRIQLQLTNNSGKDYLWCYHTVKIIDIY